nr:protein RKD1-like [Ipomoea batatas]
MANPASSPSFSQHIDRSYIGTSEYAEYSIWDDQYEDFPPAGETLESFHKQSSSIGPEFDPFWDFKNEVEGLSKAKDVVVAEVVEVERNSIEATVAIDARDKSVAVTVFEEEGDKTLDESLSLEVVSRYFHLPLAQAAKALQIGEASLKKIRCRLGIKRWPFRKLHSLEKLIKDVQCFKKFKGEVEKEIIVRKLEEKRELILKNPNLELDNAIIKLRDRCSCSSYKKRKYPNMINLTTSDFPESPSCVLPFSSSLDPKLIVYGEVLESEPSTRDVIMSLPP